MLKRGQRVIELGNKARLMGSKTNKKMVAIGAELEGRGLTKEQQAVVDVFSGKADNQSFTAERRDGNVTIVMRQGNDTHAGTKHSVYRHYGTSVGPYTAEEVTLIPRTIETGGRKEEDGKVVYTMTRLDNGVTYKVVTEKKRGREIFDNFYTNRKASLSGTSNTPEGAHTNNNNASAANVGNNSETAKKLRSGATYFSGGGLIEEGLAGIISPRIAVEYDGKVAEVYRKNFGDHIVVADVRDVDPEELAEKVVGGVDYFHASPVCKNFSGYNVKGVETLIDIETAKSTAKFIDKVKPKVVTIENVAAYRKSEAMKMIADALDANGYEWDANIYNAADFGGYTIRKRLIVRAVRDGKLPPVPQPTGRREGGWIDAVSDIIDTLPERKQGVPHWVDERLKLDGIDYRNIDKPLYVLGNGRPNRRVSHAFADQLLPTILARNNDMIVMPDGRVLETTGRVLARVSGLPDSYQLPESHYFAHHIIGNGVPTQLTRGVIVPLIEEVFNDGGGSGRRVDTRPIQERIAEYDRANGTELDRFANFLDRERQLTEGEKPHFKVGVAGSLLQSKGIKGDIYVSTSTVAPSRHTQNADHQLSKGDWFNALNSVNNPLAITKYGNKPNSFRIYTMATINGKNICLGVDVKTKDGNIEVTDFITAFGRDIEKGLRNEELVYPDSAEKVRRNLEQSSSALDLPIYAQSSVSAANVGNNSETASESGEKIREQRVEVEGKPVRFFRTKSGEAYGFTVGGKIYIDPRIATAETPVHEYAHLWAEALRKGNAKEWQNVVGLMKGTSIWNEVRELYPDLKTDDEIADEVIAQYSGRRGAERLRDEMRKVGESDMSLTDKAKAISAIERVRQALAKFWKGVCDFLHIHYTTAEDVADRVLRDLLEGVNPNEFIGENEAADGIRYSLRRESRKKSIEALNDKFNAELEDYISHKTPQGHRFDLGMPSPYLRSAGFPDLPISMRSSVIGDKGNLQRHLFSPSDLRDLVKAIQKPIAVFRYSSDNMRNVIVDMERNGKHFLVGITLGYKAKDIEINSVSGLFPKGNHEWIKWIQDGKGVRIDQKEKVLALTTVYGLIPLSLNE